MKSNKKELVVNNIYLVKHFASKYYIDGLDIRYEDLLADGITGLIEAAEVYNPNNGTSFTSLASNNIKFYILNKIRRTSSLLTREDVLQVMRQLEDIFQDYMNNSSDLLKENNLELLNDELMNKSLLICTAYLDIFFDIHKDILISNVYKELHFLLEGLSHLEQLVLSLFYVKELTYSNIKQVLGLSEKHIYCIHIVALLKIRKLFLRKFI